MPKNDNAEDFKVYTELSMLRVVKCVAKLLIDARVGDGVSVPKNVVLTSKDVMDELKETVKMLEEARL